MKSSLTIFAMLGCICMLSSCSNKSTENTNLQEQQVPTSTLTMMDTTIYKEYIADIQANKNVELRSRLSGFLEKIYVDEGALVKSGQVLFQLNDAEYKAEYAKAKAAVNTAIADAKQVELEKERTQKLVLKNIISTTEQDLIEVQYRAALSKVEEAKAVANQASARLAQTLIRAPFSGRIDRIILKEGSLLEEGSLITNISDLSQLNVYFNISENEYLNLVSAPGFQRNDFKQTVKLTLANGQEYPDKGVAEIVESEFQPSTGSISLRAKFPNANNILKHGASGIIGVPTTTGLTAFVHQKSVFEIQDKTYVYVVNSDNTVSMKPFQAGPRVGHFYMVESGLNADEVIVFEGVQNLRDGMKVKVIKKS